MIVGTSLLVVLLLALFRPFGPHDATDTFRILPGYGVITAAAMLVVSFALPAFARRWYREERWTVGRELLDALVGIALIGLGNTLYTAWVYAMHVPPLLFLAFQVVTLVLGMVPAVCIVLLQYARYDTLFRQGARSIAGGLRPPADHPPATVVLDDGGQPLRVAAADLLVCSWDDGHLRVTMRQGVAIVTARVRTTLELVEASPDLPDRFFRCHRHHLVNLDAVDRVSGNAQGYHLHIADLPPVPVARARSTECRERLLRRSR